MNKPYRLQLTPGKTLVHLTTIAAGLLAGDHLLEDIGDEAAGVLRKLMDRIEDEINGGDASRYIDDGDPRRYFLPGSDNERRKAWLKNPVSKPYEPGSTED